jgi:hypothetical protein
MAARLAELALTAISALGRAHGGDSFWSAISTSSIGHLVRGVSVFEHRRVPFIFFASETHQSLYESTMKLGGLPGPLFSLAFEAVPASAGWP